ncbi:MAG: hypothetical protein ACREO0_03135 [Pseudoxanthomonas sp.]
MGEAILYALDAPHVVDVEAASDLVEQHEGGDDAPTANIAAFFAALLQTWPEDGSSGAVWYEDFTHNKPTGNVLEMTFDLSEFSEEVLSTLRTLAGRHGLHVFDPEGEVLYLSNGVDVSPYA